MRMSLRSARRQPCSVGSCMDGDQEPAVRAEQSTPRCEPFHSSVSGARLRVREPERDAVVMRDGEAKALRRERQPADGRGQLERALGALAGCARTPACRPTRRPRRRADRHVVDPAALAVGRDHGRCRRSASVATTLPSSPPVTMRVGVRGRSRGCRRRAPPTARSSPSAARTAATPRPARTPRSRRGNARPRPARRPRPAACARRRRDVVGVGTESLGSAMRRSTRPCMRVDASRHAALEPCRIFSSGRLRPMKTRRLSRFSPSFHGRWWSPSRIMCTPWNTKRSSSSLNDRMPLQRRMSAPPSAPGPAPRGRTCPG